MSLQHTADPTVWITVPREPDPEWAAAAAARVAPDGAWLVSALEAAATGVDESEDRLVLVDAQREATTVVDLDVLDLGADVPDPVGLEDGSTVTTEEFTAGQVRGKRTVWVTPAPEGEGEDALLTQALFVGNLNGTGYLITLRTGMLQLDQVVDVLARCEELLATVSEA